MYLARLGLPSFSCLCSENDEIFNDLKRDPKKKEKKKKNICNLPSLEFVYVINYVGTYFSLN